MAGIGHNMSAGSSKNAESASAELLPKEKMEGGKITFKCRVTRYDDNYRLLAKILKNDSAMHIVRPGVKFSLSDGDSVVLKAERPAACCSSWADGRWYNASFRLDAADVEKLAEADVVSVTIPFHGGEIIRDTAPGKEKAIRELLQTIVED